MWICNLLLNFAVLMLVCIFLLVGLFVEFVTEFYNANALGISAILSMYGLQIAEVSSILYISCCLRDLLFCMIVLLLWYLMAVVLYEKWLLLRHNNC